MKIYEDNSGSGATGWTKKESALELEDDGRFCYSELWGDYAGSSGVKIEGSWKREGDAIVLLPLRVPWEMDGWVEGQERKGTERGDTLDFGNGFTLSVPPDREEDAVVGNTGKKPLTVVLEPWGTRHEVAPGERVRIVATGPGGYGGLQVNRGAEKVVVYGWSGSQVKIVREPVQPRPVVASRPPDGETGRKDAAKLPVAPTALTPLEESRFARFEPRAPTPALALRLRRWVDELPTEGMQNRIGRLCKSNDAIPLHCTQLDVWALRTDGQVLCIDHESAAGRAEPENMRRTAYAVLAKGAATRPELWELLPPDRAGIRQCETCWGKGWTEAQPPTPQSTNYCHRCEGIGWYAL
jgi:hypothetical protein